MVKEWSWLKGGIALGLLSAFAFITYKPLGVSTSYPRSVALLLDRIAPDFVAQNAYFQQVPPVVDWQLMLVVGIVIGGFVASRVVKRAQAASCSLPEATAGGKTVAGVTEADTRAKTDTRTKADMHTEAGILHTKVDMHQADMDDGERVPARRKWMAFAGGFLILFGARLAGGCTSGHVITGMTQLATASFIFAAAVFAVGIPTARVVKRKGWA